MNNQLMHINQKFLILHRNSQLFAGRLSADSHPIPLQELDIILLSTFSGGVEIQSACKQFISNSIVTISYKNITENDFKQRVDQFIQAGLLISDSFTNRISNDEIREPIFDGKALELPDNASLKLISNFGMIPTDKGFVVWSSLKQEYFHFDIELILTLLYAIKCENIEKLLLNGPSFLNQEQYKLNVNWLIDNKFILIKSINNNVAENDNISINHSNELVIDSWKLLTKDQRIPVYFVPHMENHYPLALGLIYSALKSFKNGILLEKFQLIPLTYLSPQEFVDGPYKKFGVGVWLFSNYMWSLETNLQISRFSKQHSKGNLTIHGGPSTPGYREKCIEFFQKNPSIDITVHGEGEATITEVFECISRESNAASIDFDREMLNNVAGVSYKNLDTLTLNIISTGSRTRLKNPDEIPSPYNKGYFNSYRGNVEAAIIESNRGCPFGCTFCDWGSATNQKVRKYDMARVKDEIEWVAKNQIKVIWIADANYGLYDRDIEIASFIIKMKKKYHFPKEVVVNYTKNTTSRLAEIIKIFSNGGIISQGIISIQTTDEKTLEVINRKNIKIEKYDELSKIFSESNLPLSTDLMLGLPGITIDALKNDLQRYFDFDVSVKAYPTQLLPNSPMADPEYIKKYKIKCDDDNFLISTHSYTTNDLDTMKALYKTYTFADGYSLLRYVLRYLQWDYNIRAIDILFRLNETLKSHSDLYPKLAFAANFFETDKFMPGGWRGFYDEVADFIFREYGIKSDLALKDVLRVNEAAMADQSCQYPLVLNLAHDFEKYFADHKHQKEDKGAQLATYPSGSMTFDDPDGMSSIDSQYLQYDSHQFFWEVDSSIARAKSSSNIK
jgi:radical SAM superfamily enzyme YgiQ (UPF0313 family)